MKQNADVAIRKILEHEGGYVNHPSDPGGATNKGVTIGTLRSLGMDLDGDGDVDITDLKKLTIADAVMVYKRFYWDKVDGDLLPSGIDYAVADFAVNSGPSRAAKYLQRIVGVAQDGEIGPVTLAAVSKVDAVNVINRLCDDRLAFMKSIKGGKLWKTFGKGWSRRVADVRSHSLAIVTRKTIPDLAHQTAQETPRDEPSLLAAIMTALTGLFTRKASK